MDLRKMFKNREIKSLDDLESFISDILTNIPEELLEDSDEETANKLNEFNNSFKEYLFLYKQAFKALEERRYDNAAGILELLLEHNSDSTEIRELLAKIYTITDYPNKAIEEWKELLIIEPDNNKYVFGLANAYFLRGWYKQAILHFRQLVEIEPDNIKASLVYRLSSCCSRRNVNAPISCRIMSIGAYAAIFNAKALRRSAL